MSVISPFEFFLQLHITGRCNLKCRHCYQSENAPDEMTFEDIRGLISEFANTISEWEKLYGISYRGSFNITGGEPFLREDIFDIVRETGERGFDVFLLTNGLMIDENKAVALYKLNVKGVQVSIEGPEPVHDSIRGKGSFSGSLRGINTLLDAGLAVTMNVTLSNANAACFMDIIDIAKNIGVQRVGFSRLVPYGRGKAMLGEALSAEQVREIYCRIFEYDTGKVELVTGDPVASQYLSDNSVRTGSDVPYGGCAAGVSGLTVMPDGTVVPCRRLPVPVGNIKKDSLRELWTESKVLQNLRNRSRYSGRCGTCSRWAVCRGCRAIAFAFSKAEGREEYLSEDPQCFIASH